MSDSHEVPRVEFNDDGRSMNIDEAVAAFRDILRSKLVTVSDQRFALSIVMRPCDCDTTLDGRDQHCPLHGDKGTKP